MIFPALKILIWTFNLNEFQAVNFTSSNLQIICTQSSSCMACLAWAIVIDVPEPVTAYILRYCLYH